MVAGLEQHCPVCWTGSVLGLSHLNHLQHRIGMCPVSRSFPYATLLFPVHVIHKKTSASSEEYLEQFHPGWVNAFFMVTMDFSLKIILGFYLVNHK